MAPRPSLSRQSGTNFGRLTGTPSMQRCPSRRSCLMGATSWTPLRCAKSASVSTQSDKGSLMSTACGTECRGLYQGRTDDRRSRQGLAGPFACVQLVRLHRNE